MHRVFHRLRSQALETFNSQFKATFGCLDQAPARGLAATQRFALCAVLVYQLTLRHRAETGADLRADRKLFLQAA